MFTLVTVIHIVIALLLILFVMLQDPKGGGAFGMGGGASSQSIFGSTGASNFLTTTTKWLAGIFAVTSIGLSFMGGSFSSLTDDIAAPAAQESTAPQTTGIEATPEANGEPQKEDQTGQ